MSTTLSPRSPVSAERPLAVGGRWLGISEDHVVAVCSAGPVRPLPHTPGHVLGVTLLDDRLLPVFDLARYLGLASDVRAGGRGPSAPPSIVAQTPDPRGGALRVVIPCERVAEPLAPDAPRPFVGAPRLADYARGEVSGPDGPILLLDLPRLLEDARA